MRQCFVARNMATRSRMPRGNRCCSLLRINDRQRRVSLAVRRLSNAGRRLRRVVCGRLHPRRHLLAVCLNLARLVLALCQTCHAQLVALVRDLLLGLSRAHALLPSLRISAHHQLHYPRRWDSSHWSGSDERSGCDRHSGDCKGRLFHAWHWCVQQCAICRCDICSEKHDVGPEIKISNRMIRGRSSSEMR